MPPLLSPNENPAVFLALNEKLPFVEKLDCTSRVLNVLLDRT